MKNALLMFTKYYLKIKPKCQVTRESINQKLHIVFRKLLKRLQSNFYTRCLQRRYRKIGMMHLFTYYFKKLWFDFTNKCIHYHQLDKIASNYCKFEKCKKYFNNWINKIIMKNSLNNSNNTDTVSNNIGIVRRFSFIGRWLAYIDFQKLQAWQSRQEQKSYNTSLCYRYLKEFQNFIKQKKSSAKYIIHYNYIHLKRLCVIAFGSFSVFVVNSKYISNLDNAANKHRSNNQYRLGLMSFIMALVRKRESNKNNKIHSNGEIIVKKIFSNWIRYRFIKSIYNESYQIGVRTSKILSAIKSIDIWKDYTALLNKRNQDIHTALSYYKILKCVSAIDTLKQVSFSYKMQLESNSIANRYYIYQGFSKFYYQHLLRQKSNFISKSGYRKGINYYRLNSLEKYFDFFHEQTIDIIKYKFKLLISKKFRRKKLLKVIFNELLNHLNKGLDSLIIASNFFRLYATIKALPSLRYGIKDNYNQQIKNNENVKIGLFMFKYRNYMKIFQYLKKIIDHKQEKSIWLKSIILKLNSYYYKKYVKLFKKILKKKKKYHSIVNVVNNYNFRLLSSSFALFSYKIHKRSMARTYDKDTKLSILSYHLQEFKKLINLNRKRRKNHKKSLIYTKLGLNSFIDLRWSNQRSLSIIAAQWRMSSFISGLFIKFLIYKLNYKYYCNKQLNKFTLRKLSKRLLDWYIYCERSLAKTRQNNNLNLFYNRNSKKRGLSNWINYCKINRSNKLVELLLQKKYISMWSIKFRTRIKLKKFTSDILINKNMVGFKRLFFNEWKENVVIENQVDKLILIKNKKNIIKCFKKFKENHNRRIIKKKKIRRIRGIFASKRIHDVFVKLLSIIGKRNTNKIIENDAYQYYCNYIRKTVLEHFRLFKKKLNSEFMCKKNASNRLLKNLIMNNMSMKSTKLIMYKANMHTLKQCMSRIKNKLYYFKSNLSKKTTKLIVLNANKFYLNNKNMKFLIYLEKYAIYHQNSKYLINISKNYLIEKFNRQYFKLLLYYRRKRRKLSRQNKNMIIYSNKKKLHQVLKRFDSVIYRHFSQKQMMRLMGFHSLRSDLFRGLRAFFIR
jgi:hypothetical protein